MSLEWRYLHGTHWLCPPHKKNDKVFYGVVPARWADLTTVVDGAPGGGGEVERVDELYNVLLCNPLAASVVAGKVRHGICESEGQAPGDRFSQSAALLLHCAVMKTWCVWAHSWKTTKKLCSLVFVSIVRERHRFAPQ